MKKLVSAIAMGLALSTGGAYAASHTGAAPATDGKTAQQNKMTTCNKEAEGKKGDERKAFMKKCLSDGKTAQQNKMKSCNVEAKDKKGDERKKFMSECLKA
jgi:hypothetical protein